MPYAASRKCGGARACGVRSPGGRRNYSSTARRQYSTSSEDDLPAFLLIIGMSIICLLASAGVLMAIVTEFRSWGTAPAMKNLAEHHALTAPAHCSIPNNPHVVLAGNTFCWSLYNNKTQAPTSKELVQVTLSTTTYLEWVPFAQDAVVFNVQSICALGSLLALPSLLCSRRFRSVLAGGDSDGGLSTALLLLVLVLPGYQLAPESAWRVHPQSDPYTPTVTQFCVNACAFVPAQPAAWSGLARPSSMDLAVRPRA